MKADVYGSPWDDLEEILRDFLLKATLCDEGVIYVVSPWISNISFDKMLISHPKLVCNNILEALKQLRRSFDVRVITRCYDDRISPKELYTARLLLQEIESRKSSTLLMVLGEIVGNLIEAIESINMIRTLITNNVEVRFVPNLHAKIYISPAEVLIGSANLTVTGIKSKLKHANSELIVRVKREDPIYDRILSLAERYFEMGYPEERCVKEVLRKINKTLSEIKLRFDSLHEIEMFIENLRDQYLKLSV